MAVTINYSTFVINVLQVDLTFISGSLYELDVNAFRLTLKGIEDGEAHMPFSDTHIHNTEVTLAGLTLARTFEVISPYTVEFEDLQYTVRAVGANHNLADVKVDNQVSLITQNSPGLIVAGSGLSAVEAAQLREIHKRLQLNVTDPWIETPGTSRSVSGDIIIENTGDGVNTITGTRKP